jgi:3-hydroxyisobutyrate dehydrogenase-like beta-hydroxyacid dehydrogenase
MKKIGLIGAGLMGHGIAMNLLKHGHQLTVLEHIGNQPLDLLLGQGARTAKTASELVRHIDIVFLCVTGTPQVEQVLLAADGVLAGLQSGTIVVDCSTAIPSSTQRMATLVNNAGGHFIDSPMTRTAKEAAEGRLNLLVGASPELFAQIEPILKCFAENIVHAGGVGAGHQMKLLHNYVSLGTASLIAEAAACAQLSGVSAQTFVDVLAKGGGGGVALERMKPFILSGDADSLKFSIANALKDLTYYNAMANDIGADRAIANAIKGSLELAVQAGRGDAYVPNMVAAIAARKANN